MKEFKVNSLITLRLIDGKTVLFVNNREFKQCKFLLLNIPRNISIIEDLDSIDEIAEKLDNRLEYENEIVLDPEEEFLGHCSNLQAWVENGYDTTLLHRNLAFSLLHTLSKEGDLLAKQKFKEEIVRRFKYGNYTVQAFLFEEGYLNYLSKDEILNGVLTPEDALFMERVMKNKSYSLIPWFDLRRDLDNHNKLFFTVRKGRVVELELEIDRNMKEVPEGIENLTSLEKLDIYVFFSSDNLFGKPFSSKSVENLTLNCYEEMDIYEHFSYFPNLEWLKIRNRMDNKSSIPKIHLGESFSELNSLKTLEFHRVKIFSLHNITNLKKLEFLILFFNSFKSFPLSTIESLKSLKMLALRGTELTEKEKKKLRKRNIDLV